MNWNNGFSIAFLLCISMPQAFGQQQQQLLETRSRVDASDAIPLIAEDPQPGLFFAGPIPRTKFIADDASLNAVCAVGNKCWAVGERGVVLISEDGGQTWTTSIVSTDCCLQSVCFPGAKQRLRVPEWVLGQARGIACRLCQEVCLRPFHQAQL